MRITFTLITLLTLCYLGNTQNALPIPPLNEGTMINGARTFNLEMADGMTVLSMAPKSLNRKQLN